MKLGNNLISLCISGFATESGKVQVRSWGSFSKDNEWPDCIVLPLGLGWIGRDEEERGIRGVSALVGVEGSSNWELLLLLLLLLWRLDWWDLLGSRKGFEDARPREEEEDRLICIPVGGCSVDPTKVVFSSSAIGGSLDMSKLANEGEVSFNDSLKPRTCMTRRGNCQSMNRYNTVWSFPFRLKVFFFFTPKKQKRILKKYSHPFEDINSVMREFLPRRLNEHSLWIKIAGAGFLLLKKIHCETFCLHRLFPNWSLSYQPLPKFQAVSAVSKYNKVLQRKDACPARPKRNAI